MNVVERATRALRAPSRPTERLSDFRLSGRGGPLVALAAVAAVMHAVSGYSASLELLLELCAAYAVGFLALAALCWGAGPNPPWLVILVTAAFGAAAGGYAAAAVALAPDWNDLLLWSRVRRDWQVGAAFSAFFIGLSLVTAAIRRSEHVEFETRQRLLEARLNMLAARIEPHFLMNTLANLRYLVRSDAATAYAMLDHLSDFLQGALERSRDLRSTLDQEVQLIESYLSIMKIRLGDKLDFAIDVPDALRSRPFPALLLQTLVENAVMHGIEPADGAGFIRILAFEEGDSMRVAVADNGVGYNASNSALEGTGLKNVRERLAALDAARASLEIESPPGIGTKAVVTLPKSTG